VISLILYGCFETLQFFNRQYALESGKNFLKTHYATVESLDCYIPAERAIDQADKICTFEAKPKQIQTLVQNLNFRPINLIALSEDKLDRLLDEWDKQAKIKGIVESEVREKIYDWRRLHRIEENSCWTALGLKTRSELELYGKSENQDTFRSNFFVFYKRSSMTGCVHFPFIGG
jgi:hypothetical protein